MILSRTELSASSTSLPRDSCFLVRRYEASERKGILQRTREARQCSGFIGARRSPQDTFHWNPTSQHLMLR
jgi:hypothetical protein